MPLGEQQPTKVRLSKGQILRGRGKVPRSDIEEFGLIEESMEMDVRVDQRST